MDLELILKTAREHQQVIPVPENKGHSEIVIFLYGKAIELDPSSVEAYVGRGFALYPWNHVRDCFRIKTQVPEHYPR